MPSGHKIKISDQIKQEIITRYTSGESAVFIAKLFNFKCSKSINKILRDNGIKTRSQSQSMKIKTIVFTEQEKTKMLLMNNDPLISLIDIARVFNRAPKIIKRELAAVNVYDPLKYDKFLINKFNVIDTEEKAYWLGMLAADGCVSKKQLFLQLAEIDIGHVLKFKKFVGVDYKVSRCITILDDKEFIGYRYTVSCQNFVQSLKKHGLVPKKSLTLQFAKTIPNQLIKHYIRGLVDGDGSFYTDQSDRLHFSLISTLEVCQETQKHLIKNCQVNENKLSEIITDTGEKYYYLVYCGSQQCSRIASYLYDGANIFLDRKKEFTDNFRSNHKFDTRNRIYHK